MSTGLIDASRLPLKQVQNVKQLLSSAAARDQLAMVASKHMSPERMMRLVANALRTTPKLADAHPLSLLGAMMSAASWGLELNTSLGHCYAIPFENKRKGIVEVQLILGWRGMVLLAHRNGIYIDADLHYSDDIEWQFRKGSHALLEHVPGPGRGELLHAYAVATFRDDDKARNYVVYPREKIEAIRDGSQGYQMAVRYGKKDTPWIAHFPSMARKTMIRALFNTLPISGEVSDALELDARDGRADYAGFAMDPMGGLTVDHEIEALSGDADSFVSADRSAAKEEADAAEAEAEEKAAKEEAAAAAKARAAAASKARAAAKKAPQPEAQEAKGPEPETPEPEKAGAPEDDPLYIEVVDLVSDGITPGLIREGLAERLSKARPEVRAAIEAVFAEVAPKGDDDPDFEEV